MGTVERARVVSLDIPKMEGGFCIGWDLAVRGVCRVPSGNLAGSCMEAVRNPGDALWRFQPIN
jgi:hypothetical protein